MLKLSRWLADHGTMQVQLLGTKGIGVEKMLSCGKMKVPSFTLTHSQPQPHSFNSALLLSDEPVQQERVLSPVPGSPIQAQGMRGSECLEGDSLLDTVGTVLTALARLPYRRS